MILKYKKQILLNITKKTGMPKQKNAIRIIQGLNIMLGNVNWRASSITKEDRETLRTFELDILRLEAYGND